MDAPKPNYGNIFLLVLLIIAVLIAVLGWTKERMLSQILDVTQTELDKTQTQLAYAQSQFSSVQTQLDALRLPVLCGFGGDLPGKGMVVFFQNQSQSTLTIFGTFTHHTSNQTLNKTFILQPGQKVEMGQAQGFAFAPGDKVQLSSVGYASIKFTIRVPEKWRIEFKQ
jgi:hypothetical protein